MTEAAIEAAPIAATPADLPTFDLQQGLDPTALARACADWGLFNLTGHGIAEPTIAALRGAAAGFFALPLDQKRALARSRDNPWGYNDRELTKTRRDLKQIFDVAWSAGDAVGAPFRGATPWPARPAGFRAAVEAYAAACEALSFDLLGALAASLGVAAAGLADLFRPDHSSFLRLNHYPVTDHLEAELGPSRLGIHHHTDAGALTILLQDEVSGLQVLRDGLWHDVAPVAGALTINIGDLVQVWSNDRFPAPVHRVRAMTRAERATAAWFFNPAYLAAIAPQTPEPKHYRPFTWGEFRARRAEGDFADYGTEAQVTDYRV